MPTTPKHSVSVAGVVVDAEGRILTIQRDDNAKWEPPGGVLELDETPEDGARREIFEETGIDVRVDRLTGVYKNMKRGVVALVFKCTPVSGTLRASDETRRVEWMTLPEIQHAMEPAYQIRVQDAMAGDCAAVRNHDGVDVLST